MDRRNVVESTLAAGAALTGVAPVARAASHLANSSAAAAPREFELRYAPHFGMFKEHSGTDLVAQLEFMRAEGFTAV